MTDQMVTARRGVGGSGAKALRASASLPVSEDPLWYKNAVIYELHVRAFHDSDGDGIGDFPGLIEKLPYLQELGVTALWLLPFYPSPLKDDGYDISDYTGVNPAYGTLADVRRFIREAHRRGLRVITELVMNHTSDQHPWFQRARRAPVGSRYRDFYVWSDTPEKYQGTRIIFKDFETSNWSWDPVARQYYWHRFYSHQPDLNFDNPAVQDAMIKAMDFWFGMGVDGMRLDAVPYLYEREGTNCENLPETHAFLKVLRAHLDAHYPGSMLLAEANQWPEDAAAYFGEGDGDECHMEFHFPLMPRLFMGVQMEDRFPIVDILNQTPEIPRTAQWALFLRNHDELTLEMVTDEERDYMYRVYAHDRQARINLGIRRRLAPLLGRDRRKIELLNGLLFSLPGTPVLYYGDEIGMGDNIYLGDRDTVRTPMQWSGDRNAGFSRANPQSLYLPIIIDPAYHYETINVETQQQNPSSLLWWMKRLIGLRKQHPVFGQGDLEMLHPENGKVCAFLRRDENEHVLVVANLSRFVQPVELDLSAYRGAVPVEMFGEHKFPPIGESPYFLTLGPHAFYWFRLRGGPEPMPGCESREAPPTVEIPGALDQWLQSARARSRLANLLAEDLPCRRWFRSKAEKIRTVTIVDAIPMAVDGAPVDYSAVVVLARLEYSDNEPELYAVPLALAGPGHATALLSANPTAVVATVSRKGEVEPRLLYDAMIDPPFVRGLITMLRRRRRARGRAGQLVGQPARGARSLLQGAETLDVRLSRAEQSNTSVAFDEQIILKLFRRIEAGVNPDVEVSERLTQDAGFEHTPRYVGAIVYDAGGDEPQTVAMVQRYVDNEGDCWRYTLDALGRYYDRVLANQSSDQAVAIVPPEKRMLALAAEAPTIEVSELLGQYLASAELLGQRTAEMHLALATLHDDPAFAPEPYGTLYQRSLYQSLRNSARRSLQGLQRGLNRLSDDVRPHALTLVAREGELMARLQRVTKHRLTGLRIRCHGDYHLGQVLWTGRDFMIIDFEGEPARSLGERRLKWTPLRDVAGMLRSFDYAAHTALREEVARGRLSMETHQPQAEAWARFWQTWVCALFLRAYLQRAREGNPGLLPDDDEGVKVLLDAWLLEKAMYEVRYELNNRPDWIDIPLRGVLDMLDEPDV